MQRHVIHVDEMLAQRLDVHLAPVSHGVRFQNLHDLLDRGEGRLTWLRGSSRGCSMRGSHRAEGKTAKGRVEVGGMGNRSHTGSALPRDGKAAKGKPAWMRGSQSPERRRRVVRRFPTSLTALVRHTACASCAPASTQRCGRRGLYYPYRCRTNQCRDNTDTHRNLTGPPAGIRL